MRHVLIMALAAAAFTAATPAIAGNNNNNPPTLHGFCSLANPCVDVNGHTRTTVDPPQFGFATSGQAATGDVLIDILFPDNLTKPADFTLSGALLNNVPVTANLVSNTPWTNNNVKLDAYLGLSASPTNPLGAYLPATLDFQPGATGYYIFQVDIGTVTLPGTADVGTAGQDDFTMKLGETLPFGSYIVAFISQDGGKTYGATANSGAILETPEPATWALMLLGFGGIGLALRRRRKPALTQLA